jgi:hypothetical protein
VTRRRWWTRGEHDVYESDIRRVFFKAYEHWDAWTDRQYARVALEVRRRTEAVRVGPLHRPSLPPTFLQAQISCIRTSRRNRAFDRIWARLALVYDQEAVGRSGFTTSSASDRCTDLRIERRRSLVKNMPLSKPKRL